MTKSKIAKTTEKVVINGKVVSDTIKEYKAAIKARRKDVNARYKLIDKEDAAIYKLEDDLRALEDIARMSAVLNRVAA